MLHERERASRKSEIPEKGLPTNLIRQMLKAILKRDFNYSSGKILCSMCTNPDSFAKQIFRNYLEKNLGDPSIFPASVELEQQVIQMLGSLLSNPKVSGNIVSGGTEANILALWSARNLAKKDSAEVIVPVSAHYSFDKAADLLNLKLVKVKLNNRFQMDVKAAEKAITPRTAAIVGVAGTTDLGIVDPIAELSEIASEHDIYLHVDAAFGGFMLPFLKDLGLNSPDFDFRLPGVCSITIDPHKMGLAPIPAGAILFRNNAMTETIATRVPYLSGIEICQSTLLGTRSGASAIAVWALLKHLGKAGFRTIVERCLSLTKTLVNGIQKIDELDILTEPPLNVVGITSNKIDIHLVGKKLREYGWAISLPSNTIRIVIMPHISLACIRNLLRDIKKICEKLIDEEKK